MQCSEVQRYKHYGGTYNLLFMELRKFGNHFQGYTVRHTPKDYNLKLYRFTFRQFQFLQNSNWYARLYRRFWKSWQRVILAASTSLLARRTDFRGLRTNYSERFQHALHSETLPALCFRARTAVVNKTLVTSTNWWFTWGNLPVLLSKLSLHCSNRFRFMIS